MKKVWHRFDKWECYRHGMWTRAERASSPALLRDAIELTGDAVVYGAWMLHVVREWPVTCEHHFTDKSVNHLAHVGHCAAAMAIRCPENITRSAWAMLTDTQRGEANAAARYAVQEWARLYTTGASGDAWEEQQELWPRCIA